MESAQTPTALHLDNEELTELYHILDYYALNYAFSDVAQHLYFRVKDLKNSGDACCHSAQSSDAVGQGCTIHDCRNTSDCLCLKCFEVLGSLGGSL